MKKLTQRTGIKLNTQDKGRETDNWLTVTLPDDLFKLNIDVDFKNLVIICLNSPYKYCCFFSCKIFIFSFFSAYSHSFL